MALKILLTLLLINLSYSIKAAPNNVYTTFTAYYPDSNLGGKKIFIRGDSCNLTWNKGIELNHTSSNEWMTALMCPEDVVINIKLLLNDTTWMFGKN